jgi:sialidase-1
MDEHPEQAWSINAIGTLDEFSFRATFTPSDAFTLTLWCHAAQLARRQVIARINPPEINGFSLVIEDGYVHAEYGSAEAILTRVSGTQVTAGAWMFMALTFSARDNMLAVFSGTHHAVTQIHEPVALSAMTSLIIGGYTDPAGGHFDHSFGRNQSGWVDSVEIVPAVLSAAALAALSHPSGAEPDARFSHSALTPAPVEVTYTAALSSGARAFLWDFGDGQTGIGQTVRHSYAYAGDYVARLTVVSEGHQQAQSEHRVSLSGAQNPIRPVPVFVNGSEGHACYRIPAIVRAANGDLLAFAEGRRDSCSDSTEAIRVVCKRSGDNGATWDALSIAAQHMRGDDEFALMNPSPVVDTVRGTGRIILLYNAQSTNEWALVRGEGEARTFCIVSDDHGMTWSEPRDISDQIRGGSDWRIQRPTLGHALQLPTGRLIHASTFMSGDKSVFHSQNVLIWSDDLGETWHCGMPCPTIGLNEATAIALSDDTVLINSRAYIDGKPVGRRAVTRARFDAQDTVHYDATTYDAALIDPAVQASMLRLSDGRVLFSNPAHPHARFRLTVRISLDAAATWLTGKVIDLGPSAYSDLVEQADGRIGVLYERGNHGGIAYANFDVDWLVKT